MKKINLLLATLILAFFVSTPSIVDAKPKAKKKIEKTEDWNPTFSSEITFGSQAMKDDAAGSVTVMTDANMEALEKFHDVAMKKLAKRKDVKTVEYVEGGDKFGADMIKIRYKDGWGFDVTLDPECLEVILKPFTVDKMNNKFVNRIQKDIYNLMTDIGLDARLNNGDIGGGHVHTGMKSAFGVDNVKLFRNQVVDFMNHPEIGTGAMDDDPENSKSFIEMSKSQRARLAKWVRQVDEGHFDSVRKAANAMVKDVVLEGKPATGKNIMAAKYWALNFLRMGYLDTWDTLDPNKSWDDYLAWTAFDEVEEKARTLEYRTFRGPRSAEELKKNILLMHSRLKYMKDLDKSIPVHPAFMKGKHPSTKEKSQMFYNWVKAAGVNPLDYLYLLPSNSKERKDYKQWHREFVKNANADGFGDSKTIETAYCGNALKKVWQNAGISKLRSIR